MTMATTREVETIRAALQQGTIATKDVRFATNLLKAADENKLTTRMAPWVSILANRINGTDKEQLPDAKGVVSMLERARQRGTRFPKLWLQLSDKTPVRITIAGERSRNAGHLQITDGRRYPDNQYFGHIAPDGKFEHGRDFPKVRETLTALLRALASDPEAVASQYGHMTGRCCFCDRALDDARSVTVGYGPVCAEKYGLAWGGWNASASPSAPSRLLVQQAC